MAQNKPNADASSCFIRVGVLRSRILVGGKAAILGDQRSAGSRATGLGKVHGVQSFLAVKLWVRQT